MSLNKMQAKVVGKCKLEVGHPVVILKRKWWQIIPRVVSAFTHKQDKNKK